MRTCFTPTHVCFRVLFAAIFSFLSITAFPQSGQKFSSGGNSLGTDEFFGTNNDYPLIFKINKVQRMTLTNAGFLGIGTAAPTVMFEVAGDGKINNFNVLSNLIVGNLLSVYKIFSPNGTVDFDGSNIKTTAGITGANLSISGNGTFGTLSSGSINVSGTGGFGSLTSNDITIVGMGSFESVTSTNFINPLFVGTSNGLVLSDANGNFQKLNFDNNQSSYLRGDGTFGQLPSSDTWKADNGNIYTVNSGFVGIGIENPIEKLDVNGNANIRGYLYVQDGVIIGKRIDGQKVTSDTIDVKQLAIKYATTDSLLSLKLATEKMAVSKEINIGEKAKIGSNIIIDGITNNITTPGDITAGNLNAGNLRIFGNSSSIQSGTGSLSFGNTNLNTTGYITASTFQSSQFTGTSNGLVFSDASGNFQKLDFDGNLNNYLRGDGTFCALSIPGQGIWQNNGDHVFTVPVGYVGIGTDNPVEQLDVNGNANIRGYLYVQNGVIIGQRIYSDEVNTRKLIADTMNTGKIYTDTLDVKEIITDSLKLISLDISHLIRAKKMQLERLDGQIFKSDSLTSLNVTTESLTSRLINADGEIGTGNRISIDGTNNTITSTSPTISFGGNNLRTTGYITAGTLNVQSQSINNLQVNGTLKLDIGSHNDGDVLTYDASGNAMWKTPVLFTEKWQPATNPDDIYFGYNNTYKVGLGTNTPSEKLHIKDGSIYIDGEGQGLIVNEGGGKRVGFMKYPNHEAGIWRLGNQDFEIGRTLGSTSLTGSQTNLQTDLYIADNGNIGIGTNSPIQTLDINGCMNITNGVIQKGGPAITNTGDLGLYSRDASSYMRFVTNNQPINFYSDAATSNGIGSNVNMTIASNGNVGIGTTTPKAKLEIGNTDSDPATFRIGPWEFANYRDVVTGVYALRIQRGSIDGDGNETFDKALQLNIAGSNKTDMKLTGDLFCAEVNIVADVTWPDYVFNEEYNLKSLSELEKFLKQNKHLPDVPSAADIKEKGINVGEINAILLKKIEELTLYLIEQNKKISSLEEEMTKIKNK